jgi:lysozyme family protein
MFSRILKFVLDHEGGYVNHPADPGGATNYGITQRTLDAYNQENNLPKEDVKDLKLAKATNIYYDKYWNPEWEKLGFPLAACMFDTAVNMGVNRAYSFLNQCDNDYVKYLQLRIAAYNAIVERRPASKVFLKGWMNRVTDLRRFIDSEMEIEKQRA